MAKKTQEVVELLSCDFGTIEGIFYPKDLVLNLEFNGSPDLRKLNINAPSEFTLKNKTKEEIDGRFFVRAMFSTPEINKKGFEFTAQYNDGEVKKATISVYAEENLFLDIKSNMEKYELTDDIYIELIFKKDVTNKDIPYYQDLKNVELTSKPKLEKNKIKYTAKALGVGEAEVVFGCYENANNKAARSVKFNIVDSNSISEYIYVLNGYNFTSIGENFLSLTNNKIVLKSNEKALINEAEKQVKLKVLKRIK